MILMRAVYIYIIFLLIPCNVFSQIKAGIGMSFSNDFYQSLSNPDDESGESSKSLLISPSFGPKLYLGNSMISLSVQANIGISPVAFDWKNYKGMGAVYAPVMINVNYGGLTGFTEDKSNWGFSLSYGYHFTLTDLYFRNDDFREEQRELFYPSFAQFAGGFGSKGAAIYLYSRLSLQRSQGGVFSMGLTLEVNFIERKKWRN